MTYSDQSRSSDPDRKFIQSRKWRERLRPLQLIHEPLCRHCKAAGRVKAAEQVDHIVRPRGDKRLQIDPTNLQSLCAAHHQQKSLWERRGDGRPLTIDVDNDGWPIEAGGGTIER